MLHIGLLQNLARPPEVIARDPNFEFAADRRTAAIVRARRESSENALDDFCLDQSEAGSTFGGNPHEIVGGNDAV